MGPFIDILVWILLWVVTFGTIYFLNKKGVTYIKLYGLFVSIFMFFTLISLFYFKDVFLNMNLSLHFLPLFFLSLMYALTITLYYLFPMYIPRPSSLITQYHSQYFLRMDFRYLFSKSFDLLFQQTMIVIMVLWLSQHNYQLSQIILYFLLLFGLIHLFAFFPAGFFFGTYYLIASFIGALIFPILILTVDYGFVYSYILHFSFYTFSSLFFWLFVKKS